MTTSPIARFQRIFALLPFLAIGVACWGYLLLAWQRMGNPSMDHVWMPPVADKPWATRDFMLTFWMWSVMMIAMMTPAVFPALTAFLEGRRQPGSHFYPRVDAWLFFLGYFLIWTLFCAAMTPVQWQLHAHGLLTPMMASESMVLSAAIFILAGLYQFSPWKAEFLDHCRKLVRYGNVQKSHAFSVGLRHGIDCVASCGALMVVMVGVGVMSLTWMALLTLLVTLEVALPGCASTLRRISGFALLGFGCYLFVASGLP